MAKARVLLKIQITKRTKHMIIGESTTDQTSMGPSTDIDLSALNPCEHMKLAHQSGMETTVQTISAKRAGEAVDHFMNTKFDPVTKLQDQCERMKRNQDCIDWKRVKNNETLYITFIFDLHE